GTVIEISATSKHHLNPFDINLRSYEKGDDPVAIKSQFILSMCEAAIGNLEAAEKSIIDRCIRKIYQKYLDDPNPENIPVFKDLYNALRSVENNLHAQDVADALEIFVTGSLSVFNHRTNVDVNNRILCFDIRKLSEHLHKMGILVIVDYVWNKISNSRDKNLSTWFYVDEFHLLLNDPLTAAYSTKMWKELRKWGGKPTGITQNVTDVLLSHQVENILKNSAFIVLLGQAAGDREILAERLGISPQQMEYITDTGVGEGLIYYIDKHQHGTIIPFKDEFPTDSKLYKLMSTSNDYD
ncbi:conjugal transfer protein TraE, partial [Porcipelethomonas ammoniilytica]|uniref:VirB4-like conjugal transfer ATPase, CD1110 family n=1 Tax=Porcipelethomonas ammoniilytica TaxID=2981722 RepID=UPI000ACBC9C3|nr:conjugal transfer protein TraE [Porcipelethomonas ammoniilytica]